LAGTSANPKRKIRTNYRLKKTTFLTMEHEQQDKETLHHFNYWEAKLHNIPFQKFIKQTNEFLEDAQNNALTPHYITRMKKLFPSCKRNVISVHKTQYLETDIEIKCKIMALQQAIIEAQIEIQDLQIDLRSNTKTHQNEKSEILQQFKKIKNFVIE
jgi:hypothetical protein